VSGAVLVERATKTKSSGWQTFLHNGRALSAMGWMTLKQVIR
jgi:hypothetical protein